MRKIVAGLFVSLDGVIDNPQQWNPPYYDDELSQAVMPQVTNADLHLYGRAPTNCSAPCSPARTGHRTHPS